VDGGHDGRAVRGEVRVSKPDLIAALRRHGSMVTQTDVDVFV
jgi:hypothetical protein